MNTKIHQIEWPTVLMLVATYACWGLAVFWISQWSVVFAVICAGLAVAQHSSLQHEALHGHPFQNQTLNAALVRPGLSLFIPYGRFRDTHLAHHQDSRLTDPFDDPESNFLTQNDWQALPLLLKMLYRINATLLGRIVVGPILGQWTFMRSDMAHMKPQIARSWMAHLVTVVAVVAVVVASPMPLWSYVSAAYLGLAMLKIRTFLEHRAHEVSRARSVIIEDKGPLALLFLNNNYHAVHHMHPQVAWYRLPAFYRARRQRFLDCNDGYVYPSYTRIFARYFLKAKDPVAHPLWHRAEEKIDA